MPAPLPTPPEGGWNRPRSLRAPASLPRVGMQHAYLAIVVVSVLTVAACVLLTNRIARTHADSIAEAKLWTERVNKYVGLRSMASAISSPTTAAATRAVTSADQAAVAKAAGEFDQSIQSLIGELRVGERRGTREALIADDLSAVASSAERLKSHAADAVRLAINGQGMEPDCTPAAIDGDLKAVNAAITTVTTKVRKQQIEDAEHALETGVRLTFWQRAIALAVMPILVALGVAGWRVTRRIGRLIDQLRLAEREAEGANTAKSRFLANMSHEIRTPLTAILGYADALRDEPDHTAAGERRGAMIETINTAGQHLLAVINDILDISKIEADQMVVERVETPVTRILSQVEGMIRPKAVAKGLGFSVSLSSPLPERIMSDPTRLRQILLNLVSNAVKFTEGGSVAVTAGSETRGTAAWLVVDVTDTGAGLTAEHAGRLFRAFSQADASVTRKHGGSGLGLVISRKLAEMMGGDVTIHRTEPGRGSTFRLELPLSMSPGAAVIERLDTEIVRTGTPGLRRTKPLAGRILLAEDCTVNQRLISMILQNAGATVDVADNGKLALDALHRAATAGSPYDLLLTDMQMPEMDGTTLAQTLREQGNQITIIALTANAMAEDRLRCLQAGCNDYATKPIERERLISVCSQWLHAPATARAAA